MLKEEFKQWQALPACVTGRLKGASLKKMTQQHHFKLFEVAGFVPVAVQPCFPVAELL